MNSGGPFQTIAATKALGPPRSRGEHNAAPSTTQAGSRQGTLDPGVLARQPQWPVKEPGERARGQATGAPPATPVDSSGGSEDEPGSRAQSLTPQQSCSGPRAENPWAEKLGCQAGNHQTPRILSLWETQGPTAETPVGRTSEALGSSEESSESQTRHSTLLGTGWKPAMWQGYGWATLPVRLWGQGICPASSGSLPEDRLALQALSAASDCLCAWGILEKCRDCSSSSGQNALGRNEN